MADTGGVTPAPRISIVIVCFGKREVTEDCLASLDAVFGPRLGRDVEVVVVDNASPDDTLTLLRAWQDRITVLALPENRNFSGGCNAGAEASRGDVIIFLNNDTIVGPGVLDAIAETASDPSVGIAGMRLVYPDGVLQHGGVVMTTFQGDVTASHVFQHDDGALPAARAVLDMDCVTAACMAMRRDVFFDAGGFDEGYVNGNEDVDLCLRVRVQGLRVVYRGDLSLVHAEGKSRRGASQQDNVARFRDAWASMLDTDDAMAAHVWGARIRPIIPEPPRDLPSTIVVVVGPVRGIGSAADELRALLVGFARAGRPAVAVEPPYGVTEPPLTGELAEVVDQALRREIPVAGLQVEVPSGPSTAAKVHAEAMLRVPDDAWDEHPGGAERRLSDLPSPVVAPDAPGPGGEGLLVHLPTHDAALTAELLDALTAIAPARCRIVPTVTSAGLADRVAAVLPDAELVPPCADEQRWIAWAARADVAVCLDPDDGFGRRALAAAAAGALPVVAAGNRAAATLGAHAIVLPAGPLADTLTGAVALPHGDREARAAHVRETCDPATIARAIVNRARVAA
jgi:GT2 family glycosyltransferase